MIQFKSKGDYNLDNTYAIMFAIKYNGKLMQWEVWRKYKSLKAVLQAWEVFKKKKRKTTWRHKR